MFGAAGFMRVAFAKASLVKRRPVDRRVHRPDKATRPLVDETDPNPARRTLVMVAYLQHVLLKKPAA
jgi:hypothetical protein